MMMMTKTIAAIAAIVAFAGLAPVANAGCNWTGCNGTTEDVNVDINVTLPDTFGFAAADGAYTANANATSVGATGESGAAAASANGGTASASNTTSSGGTAPNGATAGGSSESSASTGY